MYARTQVCKCETKGIHASLGIKESFNFSPIGDTLLSQARKKKTLSLLIVIIGGTPLTMAFDLSQEPMSIPASAIKSH